MGEELLALIPARGGSKRFPRKNMALLAGKPLLAWTIEAALKAEIFDRIVVSSDDHALLELSRDYGIQVAERPSSLAGDQATVVQVSLQYLEDLRARHLSLPCALYVMLPTSPFRSVQSIRSAWRVFRASGADALLSVAELASPPEWSLRQTDGYLVPSYPDQYERSRSQIAPTFRHDGGHAIVKVEHFLAVRTFLGGRTVPLLVPDIEAVDIDKEIDILWAEFLLKAAT